MTSRFFSATTSGHSSRPPARRAKRASKVRSALAIDEQAVQRRQELVAGGAVHVPALRHRLLPDQHLLHHHVERPPRQAARLQLREDALQQRRLGGRIELLAARRRQRPAALEQVAGLEPTEVGGRDVEAVGVVDAQAGGEPVAQEPEHEPVRLREHRRLLHADGGQPVDVEEAPVVDLVAGHAPEGQAVRLRVEEPLQEVEAARIAGRTVEDPDVLVDVQPHRLAAVAQRRQPALGDLLLAGALQHRGGGGLRTRRELLQRGA